MGPNRRFWPTGTGTLRTADGDGGAPQGRHPIEGCAERTFALGDERVEDRRAPARSNSIRRSNALERI